MAYSKTTGKQKILSRSMPPKLINMPSASYNIIIKKIGFFKLKFTSKRSLKNLFMGSFSLTYDF